MVVLIVIQVLAIALFGWLAFATQKASIEFRNNYETNPRIVALSRRFKKMIKMGFPIVVWLMLFMSAANTYLLGFTIFKLVK